MKDFLRKITGSTTSKIITCLVIAIPIWLIIMFTRNKEPEKNVDVVANSSITTSSQSEGSSETASSNTNSSSDDTSSGTNSNEDASSSVGSVSDEDAGEIE